MFSVGYHEVSDVKWVRGKWVDREWSMELEDLWGDSR
jgi:hypothetical protein